jgi:hypothetical protein
MVCTINRGFAQTGALAEQVIAAAIVLADVWTDAIELPVAESTRAMQSAWAAAATSPISAGTSASNISCSFA